MWGATTAGACRLPCGSISIHAPRVGRDLLGDAVHADDDDFNPRAPCGARPARPARIGCRNVYFNPRAPCGARLVEAGGRTCYLSISIHAPRVGRDADRGNHKEVGRNFNPRAPCGARPCFFLAVRQAAQFQSTRPVWGATPTTDAGGPCHVISIHAPRVGRDQVHHDLSAVRQDFNPRAPCGARPSSCAWVRAAN